jgi:serine carboxypeptidase-like clade 2
MYNVYAKCFNETPEGSTRMKSPIRINNDDDGDVPPCVDVVGLYYWLKKTEVRSVRDLIKLAISCKNRIF